ncbi:MAG: zf-HC2 domain-containing protein [Bacteroidetes bacterium]|nr:zf-HC2 domain-containing protein [Bacteroidota bacterium]
MNCKQIHKLLPDYLDQNLSEERSILVRTHIESCKDCAMLYNKMQQSLNFLKPTSEISEQPFYFTRLKQRMENTMETKTSILSLRISKKVLQPLIYLSSLVIAVYIGILIGSNSSMPNQFTGLNSQEQKYIEEFVEYNYLNDLEIEPIETLFLIDSSSVNK